MNLCSNGHIEICYTAAFCPVCDLISDYDGQLEELRDTIKELKQELEDK